MMMKFTVMMTMKMFIYSIQLSTYLINMIIIIMSLNYGFKSMVEKSDYSSKKVTQTPVGSSIGFFKRQIVMFVK